MKVIDLFCGAGGFSAGIDQVSEIEVECGIDKNKKACQVHRENLDDTCLNKDIRNLDLELVENVDWVHSSPPCQDFSSINKFEDKNRNELLYVSCERINEVNPEFFTIENVTGLMKMVDKNGNSYIEELKRKLTEYNIEVHNINMGKYGVPQTRRRIIIFGSKSHDPNRMIPEKEKEKKGMNEVIDTGDYKYQISVGNCTRQLKGKSQIRSVEEPSYTILTSNRPSIVKEWNPPYTRMKECNKRILSVDETKKLQTFPDWFSFESVGKTTSNMLIGNAFPSEFARKLGGEMEKFD